MIAAALPLLLVAASGATPPGWRTYLNPRFAYRICYPATMQPGRPPDNGDGLAFTDPAGGELSVWGAQDVMNGGIAAEMESNRGYWAGDDIGVTYIAKGKDWYVLSGRKGDSIIYQRVRLTKGRFTAFRLTYPVRTAARWNPLIAQFAACLRDTGRS